MARYVRVAEADAVSSGKSKLVMAEGRRIALFNDAGMLCALDDVCTHVGGPLSEGLCEGGVVTCPWHGAQFRIRDGLVLGPPARRNVRTYPVRVVDGTVEVELED